MGLFDIFKKKDEFIKIEIKKIKNLEKKSKLS